MNNQQNTIKHGYQTIVSFISIYGIVTYEILEFDSIKDGWYIVGDTSVNRDYLQKQVNKHNQQINK